MDEKALRNLIPKKPLRQDFLKRIAKRNDVGVWSCYDRKWDSLTVQFVPPETPVVARFVGDQISVLYRKDLQIVGILIEDFVRSFLPEHAKMQAAWQLSDRARKELKNYADVARISKAHNSTIAREAVKASRSILGKGGFLIPQALSNGAIRQVQFESL